MDYPVGEVARAAGVTVRTLHHYEEIGLLVPSARTNSGYRLYGQADLERLQQILFYRELGFSLASIAALLDDPKADAMAHLSYQRQLLSERIERLEAMVSAVDRAMEDKKMGTEPRPEDRFAAVTSVAVGKVRDVYEAGEGLLLMVASDRMSAFDVVMAEPVPNKGRVLTAFSAYWLAELADVAPNHLVSVDPSEFPESVSGVSDVAGRAMLVRKAEMLPVECIVRGYLAGSAWKEYRSSGTIHGEPQPHGLEQSDRLPEPVFTPSTKAKSGHDENISFEAAVDLLGKELADAARDISLAAYERAARRAAERGVIIADTKFELGLIDGRLAICDEVLTPDSSRFWPADAWRPGTAPPSYDKQPLRDWLEATGWDKSPPPPTLPPDVVDETSARYRSAYEMITGRKLSDWYGVTG
ncbi:MAG TPA: phosphoribosylaminoimidazolesuccinocarboxamide synthase [Acidimicrobiales bacterium]|nr:phosphoribosylaminoimidazolesuccinocarboxamide synthase [Acidimicrobiales bacterium]